jgi:hypothetical protein
VRRPRKGVETLKNGQFYASFHHLNNQNLVDLHPQLENEMKKAAYVHFLSGYSSWAYSYWEAGKT